ncbi:ABC transporter ATP-binding protein [Senegalia massiliensis]|uniref:ABC transporter ATP-binding protein n=1 Tax=Senegalia massiliensis TaxID=1720316 RepID=UPI0010311674|nr:ABC transporter ATP-binding protein [Senegalia massiliensis]
MINNNKNNISLMKIIFRIFPMAFAASPLYFILGNLVAILHGISHGFRTLMTQKLFDSVPLLILNDNVFGEVILIAITLALTFIMIQILNGADNFMIIDNGNIIIGYIEQKVNEKAGKVDIISFENPEYLDDIRRAKEGISGSAELVSTLTSLISLYVPYFIFMGIYLYNLKPILMVSLIIIFIPTFITQFIRVKIFTDLADESGPIRREYEYYEKCIVDKQYFKETRMLGAFHYFKELYTCSLNLLNKEIWKAEKKIGIIELFMRLLTVLGYIGVLYLLFISLLNGEISSGAFGAVFGSLGFMFNVMEQIVCIRIGEISNNLGTIKNLIRFLDMPERGGKDYNIDEKPDIALNNVSFSYPGAKKPSLTNINLDIKSGETITIVGENGAGKTTLVKLIMGLYTPIKGKVTVGGKDTSEISTKSIYKNVSAVFQKYQRYEMTLGENIEIGSLNKIANKDSITRNKFLDEAVLKADLEISEQKLKNGYDTMISREFNGIDLSGGQWQKIAIARGFYRNHNMIVLDEPTAAIDPAMETNLYNKFSELAEEKTAIIVTHRLGSAKIGDIIIVMDNGQIAEIGSHDELMDMDGKYTRMYSAQSKWYSQTC